MEKKLTSLSKSNTSISDCIINLIKEYHKLPIVSPRLIFNNYTLGHGTCLTTKGFELILPVIQMYPVSIDLKFRTNTTKNKILLAKAIKHPYYLEKGKIWFSNDQDAFMLTLHQGSILTWATGMCS